MPAPIEGYASATSVGPNDALDFHVRADAAHRHFTIEVYRRGLDDELLKTAEDDAFVPGAQDDVGAAVNGCDWPAAARCRTIVQPGWRSGYYVAKISAGDAQGWIPFVVRADRGASNAKILAKISDTTSQAYNGWGGRSFYSAPSSPRITFDRPYDDLSLYEKYQLPFIRWAEKRGIALDYCSSLDLHADPNQLAGYQLFLSLGHDEYWSLEMRDQVEAFIASGGNVCFFSANTCFWQIRFDPSSGKRIMICYKESEAGHAPDPDRADPHRVTTEWSKSPVSRPENSMTGVSYRNGAGWWVDPIDPARRFRGYTVARAAHWAFAQTDLSDGDVFGKGTGVDDTILGYETDAALLAPGSPPPAVTGADGTPKNLVVLATADLRDWAPNGKGGYATMGLYRRTGVAFTGGTVNWCGGLSEDGSTAVDKITRNLITALQNAQSRFLALANARFEEWQNGSPVGWALDGAGKIAPEARDAHVATNYMRFMDLRGSSLRVDATAGETWISQSDLSFDPNAVYAAGCWAKADKPGATIRLQTTDTWQDFATAGHSGNGQWEYLFALGSRNDRNAPLPARVKIQVAAGMQASFDGVTVAEIRGDP